MFPSKEKEKNKDTIFLAAINGNNEEIIKMLNKGEDINAKNNVGWTALMTAARNSNTGSSSVKLLLDRGADPNLKDNEGWTALMMAARNSNTDSSLDTVKLLLDRGADPNLKNNEGWTALIMATRNSNTDSSLDTVKLLLDRGADPNLKEDDGFTALMMAARQSNTDSSLDTVKLLLDRGADPNLKNNDGWTALMLAAQNSITSLDTVKLLLNRGTNPFGTIHGKDIINYCPTEECKNLISEHIWKILYARDKEMSSRYAKSTPISKDVWEIILLNKRQQQLCKDLSSEKNREILELFAIEYGIPVTKGMTKAKLCGLISRQLVYGVKYGGEAEKDLEERKKDILRVAKKFGINTNQSIDNIIKDIGEILK